MKSKKLLTIITFAVSVLSLAIAMVVGKDNGGMLYDICMALFGGAVLSFLMSIAEYYVERRKAMEAFYVQSMNVLSAIRKIKYLHIDAPLDFVKETLAEQSYNESIKELNAFCGTKFRYEARDKLKLWLMADRGYYLMDYDDYDRVADQLYDSCMAECQNTFNDCMNYYKTVASVELHDLDNAFGNLDFMTGKNAVCNRLSIFVFGRIKNTIIKIRKEVYHFDLLDDNKGNYVACISKLKGLNDEYFMEKYISDEGNSWLTIFQNEFDDIDVALEKFRCKIYGQKYDDIAAKPVSIRLLRCNNQKEM